MRRQCDQAHAGDVWASNHQLLKLETVRQQRKRKQWCRWSLPGHPEIRLFRGHRVQPLVRRVRARPNGMGLCGVGGLVCRRALTNPLTQRTCALRAQGVGFRPGTRRDKEVGRVWRLVPAVSPAPRGAAKPSLDPVPNGGRRPVEPVRIVGRHQAGAGRRRGRHQLRRAGRKLW